MFRKTGSGIGDCEGFHGVYTYEGILLRDLLEKLRLPSFPYPYDRFIAITSENGFCATYSIGELFNSRLGNNIIVAYRKDGQTLGPEEGFAMMVAAEDNTGGRSVKRISRLILY
jgi:DMSO/TMAO reductase YedYZ molybdopterin-dependent catalytic subunit